MSEERRPRAPPRPPDLVARAVVVVVPPPPEGADAPSQLPLFLQQIPGVLWTTDADLRITEALGRGFTDNGLDPRALVGRKISELPDASEAMLTAHEAAINEGRPSDYDLRYGGRLFDVRVEPVYAADGRIIGAVGTGNDFTERADAARSEARYRELFERASEMIIVLDPSGCFTEVNPAAERALGYAATELVGTPLARLLEVDEVTRAAERLRRKLDGSEPATTYEAVMIARDGRRVEIEVSTQVILEDGRPAGVLAIGRDVSDQKAARAALVESERRFRGAFDDAAVGMMLTDPEGTILRVNAAFADMVGYQPHELIGLSVRDITHPDDVAQIEPDIELMRRGVKRRRVAEKRYIRRDGGIVWGHVGVSPVRDDAGEIQMFVAQIENVTKLRRVQQELEESQRLHRAVVESSRDLLAVIGADGTIRLTSRSIEAMLGYGESELVGRHFLGFVHEEDRAHVLAVLDEALRGEQATTTVGRVRAKDGTYRPLEGTVAGGVDGNGDPSFAVANLRDVTDRLRIEEHMRRAQKLEAVGRLAGGVAHDFNNLLLAIRGYGELALQRIAAEDAGAAEDVGEILGAADRAAGLTRQLLAFSRRQVMHPEVLDLREVVEDMAKLLRRLIGEDIELATTYGDEPVRVEADRAQMEQVLVNLAVNARDAMPDGGRLTIDVVLPDDAERAVLVVADNGCGMDASTAAHVFEPFFTTKSEGTGLGLATVHGIVTQTGGEVRFVSKPGAGTTFTITLPVTERPATPRGAAAPPAAATGNESILLIEDEPAVRAVIGEMLELLGYRVTVAESGEAAVTMAADESLPVDLVLTDLVLRGMGGRETAKTIRARRPNARVLHMSGYSEEWANDDFTAGTAFIQKPFSRDELAERVRALLDAQS